MNTFSTVAIILAASLVVLGSPYRVAPKVYVSRGTRNHDSELESIYGLRSCGGPGHVLDWRIEGCQRNSICRLPGDGQLRDSELEFIPSEHIEALGIRFILITDGEAQTIYERPISNSAVEKGEIYELHTRAGASPELRGKNITTQYILYRVDSNDVEICAEADFEIY